MTSEIIKIQINDEIIELTGAEKEAFIADREANNEARLLLETQKKEKQQAAIAKLAALGLTTDDLKALGL